MELQIIEGVPTPTPADVEKEEVPKEEAETQTEIAMEYFDRQPASRGSKGSKSQSQMEEQKDAMLNNNSSTAMGTNQHGNSL